MDTPKDWKSIYWKAKYIGPRQDLFGETTLCTRNYNSHFIDPSCLCQFDNRSLKEAFGWWPISLKDLEVIPTKE